MTTLSLTPAPGKDNAFDNALDEQYSTRMTTLKKYGNNQFRNYIIALKSGERGDELDFWEQFLKMHLCQEGREKMELLAQSRPVVKNYSHTIGMGFLVEMNTIALKMVCILFMCTYVHALINHLKMVKGCRIDTELCKKPLSKKDSPKTLGTRVSCKTGTGLDGQRARQARAR